MLVRNRRCARWAALALAIGAPSLWAALTNSPVYPPPPEITASDEQWRDWLRAIRTGSNVDVSARGRPAVLVAVVVDDLESLKILLESGADPNPPLPIGSLPPLHVAVELGRTEMVRILLSHGASVTAVGEGQSAFGLAAKRGDDVVMQALLDASTARNELFDGIKPFGIAFLDDALCEAARHGRAAWIDRLLDAGADINAVQTGAYSPLINATIQGHTEIVRTLLRRGARVNAAPAPGRSALYFAALGPGDHFPEMAQVLGEFGARARTEMLVDCMINRRMDRFATLLTMNPRPQDLLEVMDKSITSSRAEAVQLLVDAKLPDGSPAVPLATEIMQRAERYAKDVSTPEAERVVEILKAAAQSR